MLSINNLSYSIGERDLFIDIKTSFVPGEKYAVTGPNGCGKSTFFGILYGHINEYKGNIGRSGRISILEQKLSDAQKEMIMLDFVIQGNKPLWDAMTQRDYLYTLECTDEIGIKISEIEDKISLLGGYTIDSEAEKMLEKFGINKSLFNKPLSAADYGDQMKAKLVRAMIGNPSILLLDEPTNGIDVFAVEWLKDFLINKYNGILLFISHDINFINDVATIIADIDYQQITLYPGSYDDMVEEKRNIRNALEKRNESLEKRAEKLKLFINRFGSGTRAKQAQSKSKMLDKLSIADLKESNVIVPYITFNIGKPSARNVVNVEGLGKTFDNKTIFSGFNLNIIRGEKIAIIGKNGSGKSVLSKILCSRLDQTEGNITYGKDVVVGYFPQFHEEDIDENDKDLTVLEWIMNKVPKKTMEDIRNILGRMLFSKEEVNKKMKVLSGGETARCLMSKILLEEANFIVLDDPCSHLDIGSVIALKRAISQSEKTFVISTNSNIHDVCEKLIIMDSDGHVPQTYIGTFKDFLSKRKK